MKKTFLLALILFSFMNSNAQITLDTVITTWNSIGYDFYPVDISDNETKYYMQDTLTNSFSLYNLDFTPFILNIAVPVPFAPFTAAYEPVYITRSLFDCDTSNIEYFYVSTGSGYGNRTLYIMRTDGTELFRKDTAYLPWCYGCVYGSDEIKGIRNTSEGTKMFLYYPSSIKNLHIYTLCGELPKYYTMIQKPKDADQFVSIYPNPTSGELMLSVKAYNQNDLYELFIYDVTGNILLHNNLPSGIQSHTIDLTQFTSATVFYSLLNNNHIIKSGKIIVQK